VAPSSVDRRGRIEVVQDPNFDMDCYRYKSENRLDKQAAKDKHS
jgi:hypothetical protein